MVFKKRNRHLDDEIEDIYINNYKIDKVYCTKFLGIAVDDSLTWSCHIDEIMGKIARAIGVLYRIRPFIPLRILTNLYNTLILPYLSYCNIVWGKCSNTLINKLYVLQKRALRAITNSHPRTPSDPLFKKLKVLNIFDICKLQTALFMYKYLNNLLPEVFNNMFMLNSEMHQYNTRYSNRPRVQLLKYESSRQTVRHLGPQLWNSLSDDIKNSPSPASFKGKYKQCLLKC